MVMVNGTNPNYIYKIKYDCINISFSPYGYIIIQKPTLESNRQKIKK